MGHKDARIDSPDVLKELRVKFVKFAQACHQALGSCDSDVKSTASWLATDQRMFLKLQLRKADEALTVAQRDYSQAKWGASDLNRSSGTEEKRQLEKAKRRKEDVERRVAAVERWSVRLDEEVGRLRKPCISLANLLDHTTPRALASIDRMLDSLEDYLRPAPPEAP